MSMLKGEQNSVRDREREREREREGERERQRGGSPVNDD